MLVIISAMCILCMPPNIQCVCIECKVLNTCIFMWSKVKVQCLIWGEQTMSSAPYLKCVNLMCMVNISIFTQCVLFNKYGVFNCVVAVDAL